MNYVQMQRGKGLNMNAEERVSWLNENDRLRRWSVGEDVFCLHCHGVFKAEDVACDYVGDPTCPLCISSTPLDFAKIPCRRVEPARAVAGKPGRLWARGYEHSLAVRGSI